MNLVYLDGKKEPYTTSEITAECADVQHHTITRLIRENKDDFEALGILGFKIHKLDGRGQPKKAYILNEQQATLNADSETAIGTLDMLDDEAIDLFKSLDVDNEYQGLEYYNTSLNKED